MPLCPAGAQNHRMLAWGIHKVPDVCQQGQSHQCVATNLDDSQLSGRVVNLAGLWAAMQLQHTRLNGRLKDALCFDDEGR